jgi:hypothetical protein
MHEPRRSATIIRWTIDYHEKVEASGQTPGFPHSSGEGR